MLQCSFSLENTNSVLTFVTLSGELKARQVKDHIVLDLPLYTAYPQVSQNFIHDRLSRKVCVCMCMSVYVCVDTHLHIAFFTVCVCFFSLQELKEVEELIKVKEVSISCLRKTFIIALLIFMY